MKVLIRLLSVLRMEKTTLVILLVALVTLVSGFSGWYSFLTTPPNHSPYPVQEAVYRALTAFTLNGVYETPNDWNHSWRIYLARWGGTFVAFTAVLRAAVLLFSKPISRLRAALRTGHAAVIGDAPFAHSFTAIWAQKGHKVTHHRSETVENGDGILTQPYSRGLLTGPLKDSLRGANRILVAEDSDTATAQIALTLAQEYSDIPVFALFRDPWMSRHVGHAFQLSDDPDRQGDLLIGISESAGAARAVLSAHPPFLQARCVGARQIHALIVGFDGLGAALVTDMLNSSLVSFLERPVFTVIDRDAARRRSAFLARHPGLDEHVDIFFVEADVERLSPQDFMELNRRSDAAPITGVYVATSRLGTPMADALILAAAARRENLFDAPIFFRAPDGAGLKPVAPGARLHERQLVPFGSPMAVMTATGVLDATPDKAARTHHEEYQTFMSERPAATPWNTLPELYRTSNRRAIEHLPAKLASAGFDLNLSADTGLHSIPALGPDEMLCETPEIKDQLARLEHLRWMMDRWLDGWRFGEVRDDATLRHPNLIDYDDLTPEIQSYDIRLVEWLDSFLPRRSDGLKRDRTP